MNSTFGNMDKCPMCSFSIFLLFDLRSQPRTALAHYPINVHLG